MIKKRNILLLLALMLIFVIPVITNNPTDSTTPLLIQKDGGVPAADGESWLAGYQYREKLNFYVVAGSGTYYQIDLNVYSDAADGSDGANGVSTESHCQTDFGDIRFTKADGITELDYWIESYTPDDTAIVWLEVEGDLSTSDPKAYIYYGTSGTSTTTSDGEATFILFDDFEDNNLDNWATTSNMEIATARTHDSSTYSASWTSSASNALMQDNSYGGLSGISISFWNNVEDTTRGSFIWAYTEDDYSERVTTIRSSYEAATSEMYYRDSGTYVSYPSSADDLNDDEWDKIEFAVDFDADKMQTWQNGVANGQLAVVEDDGTPCETEEVDGMGLMMQTGKQVWFDDVIVRKWNGAGEPFMSDPSAEEVAEVDNVSAEWTNPDDANNLYASREYYLECVVEIESGYEDIDYIYVTLKQGVSTLGEWKYDEDVDTFYNMGGVSLCDTGASTAVGDGIELTVTFYITIAWTQNDLEEYFIHLRSLDVFTTDDEDDYGDYDVETRLDLSTYSLDDGTGTSDRGDYDTEDGITAAGTVIFYGGSVSPASDAVDVWVSCGDITGSPWSDLTLSSGAFSMTVDSDDVITGSPNEYTFKVVEESDGSGGTDQCHTTHTDDYKADRVQIQSYTVTPETRVRIGVNIIFKALLWYDYDDTIVETGTVTFNTLSTAYIGTGLWGNTKNYGYVTSLTYDDVEITGDTYGLTKVDQNGQSTTGIWDRVKINITSNVQWAFIDSNVTLYATGTHEYDDSVWSGTITWSGKYPTESVVNSYEYDSSVISSITNDDYSWVTAFVSFGTTDVVFDDIEFASGPAYYWSQYSETQVWLIWGVASSYQWAYNTSPLQNGILIQSSINGTDNAKTTTYGGSIGGLSIGIFDAEWYYATIRIDAEFGSYDHTIWECTLEVSILHSLQIVNFNIVPTDDYFWITFQSNLLNGSIAAWDDAIDSGTLFTNNIYYSEFEGMHQIPRSTILGAHNITLCITSTGTQYDRDYTVGDYVWWYNFTYVVVGSSYDAHIVIINNLFELVPFDTFEVYVNGTRIYQDLYYVTEGNAYNITVKNRYGDYLNASATFDATREMVVMVQMYSLKFMSWFDGFCEVNISRSGISYTEIIMPLEIVNFKLYSAEYIYVIDYLNGTVSAEYGINLINSTGVIITGNTIADIMSMSEELWDLVYEVNVTITSTNNYVLTLTIDLDNINTTIGTQLIQILLDIDNNNSTIYDQTVDLLAAVQNTNTTIYSQLASFIVSVYNNQTSIYDQTVTLLANIANIDSDIVAQTVTLLAEIENVNSTIYAQTVSILTNIANINSTLYAQTVSILSQITNMNSTIYAQTISILSYVIDTNSAINVVLDPDNFNIIFADVSYSDVFAHFYVMSNWHNGTVTIYENDVLATTPVSETTVPILYTLTTAAGTYNLSVKIVSGVYVEWYNTSYTIAELIAFSLDEWDVDLHLGIENYVEAYVKTTWENSTIYVYDNGTLMVTVLEGDGGTSFYWWMKQGQGIHNIVLNITNGVDTITKTRSYFVPDWASTGLVGRFDIWNMQENDTAIRTESNWGNTTVYIYFDSELKATSSDDPAYASFARDSNVGTFNLTIVWVGGTQSYTLSGVMFTVSEEGATYIYGGVVMPGNETILVITQVTSIAPPPPGLYVSTDSQIILVIGIVGGFAGIIVVARTLLLKEREKSVRSQS